MLIDKLKGKATLLAIVKTRGELPAKSAKEQYFRIPEYACGRDRSWWLVIANLKLQRQTMPTELEAMLLLHGSATGRDKKRGEFIACSQRSWHPVVG